MHILITGSVATGKTELAKRVAERLGIEVFHLSDVIVENRLYTGMDQQYQSYVPDEDALIQYLRENIIQKYKDFIIDHHSFDIFSSKFFDAVFVLRTELGELRSRLEKRGYPEVKIYENLCCETMEVVSLEAHNRLHNVFEFSSNTAKEQEENLKMICTIVKQIRETEPNESQFEQEEEE